MPDQDKAREQFEAWANLQGVSVKRVSERENALYTDYATYLAWQVWMKLHAATAAASQDREELVEALTHARDFADTAHDGEHGYSECTRDELVERLGALIAKHRS